MGPLIFLLLLALPIVELYVIVQVAEQVGVLETLALLIGMSVAGAWLLKQQGLATWRSLQATMSRGEVPTKEATDGALILLGGALLMTPGFVSDAFGLVLLLPPTRALVKSLARKVFGAWAIRRAGAAGHVYSATVTRTRRAPGSSEEPSPQSGRGHPASPQSGRGHPASPQSGRGHPAVNPGRLPGEDPGGGAGSPDRG